jgi:hypothetical protein
MRGAGAVVFVDLNGVEELGNVESFDIGNLLAAKLGEIQFSKARYRSLADRMLPPSMSGGCHRGGLCLNCAIASIGPNIICNDGSGFESLLRHYETDGLVWVKLLPREGRPARGCTGEAAGANWIRAISRALELVAIPDLRPRTRSPLFLRHDASESGHPFGWALKIQITGLDYMNSPHIMLPIMAGPEPRCASLVRLCDAMA